MMWILLLDTSKKMPRRRRGHGWTRRRPLQLLLPPPPTQPRHKCEPLPAYHITTTVALFAAAVDFIGTTSLKLPPHSSLQINEDHLCPLSRRSRQMSTTGGWQFMSSVYEVLFSLFLSSPPPSSRRRSRTPHRWHQPFQHGHIHLMPTPTPPTASGLPPLHSLLKSVGAHTIPIFVCWIRIKRKNQSRRSFSLLQPQ